MKKRFKRLTEDEIKAAYHYQRENSDWTFYQEKELVETIFLNKFNYLLVVYSLCVSGFFMTDSRENKLIILFIGFLIISMLCLFLYRCYFRLMILLRIVYSLDDKNPLSIVDIEMKAGGKLAIFQTNFLIGIIIPVIMTSSFLVGIITMITNIWNL